MAVHAAAAAGARARAEEGVDCRQTPALRGRSPPPTPAARPPTRINTRRNRKRRELSEERESQTPSRATAAEPARCRRGPERAGKGARARRKIARCAPPAGPGACQLTASRRLVRPVTSLSRPHRGCMYRSTAPESRRIPAALSLSLAPARLESASSAAPSSFRRFLPRFALSYIYISARAGSLLRRAPATPKESAPRAGLRVPRASLSTIRQVSLRASRT